MRLSTKAARQVPVQYAKMKETMETKNFNLSLTVDQLNVIMAALGELPFKSSNELIQTIVKQFTEQQTPPNIIDVE